MNRQKISGFLACLAATKDRSTILSPWSARILRNAEYSGFTLSQYLKNIKNPLMGALNKVK